MTGAATKQPIALIDANILFSELLRDVLLRAAEKRLYQLRVTHEIWQETVRNLISTQTMTDEQAAHLTEHAMRLFENLDALVNDYEPLIPDLTNHVKDRHVLAAAIVGDAEVIVTLNGKHFPRSSLKPYGIEAQRPGVFLAQFCPVHTEAMFDIIRGRVKHNRKPPTTEEAVIAALAKVAPEFVQALTKQSG